LRNQVASQTKYFATSLDVDRVSDCQFTGWSSRCEFPLSASNSSTGDFIVTDVKRDA